MTTTESNAPEAVQISAPVQARGFDISSNNHGGSIFNWHAARLQGWEFVYIKATQGIGYVNEYLLGDVRDAVNAGFRVGLYHFWDGSGNAEEQAAHFIENGIAQVVREIGPHSLALVPVLDYEETGPIAAERDQFIEAMHAHHFPCGQYVDRYYLSVVGDGNAAFTWVADPGWYPGIEEPPFWKENKVAMVQYGTGTVMGIGMVDNDHCLNVGAIMLDAQPAPTPKAPQVDLPPVPGETAAQEVAAVETTTPVAPTLTHEKADGLEGAKVGELWHWSDGTYSIRQ